jgi:hypothetical protein
MDTTIEAVRERAAKELVWLSEDTGYGFGICGVAGMMAWAMDEPGPDRPDHPSIVFVQGPIEKYGDEELELILAFGKRRTAQYDRMFSIRRGCNAIILNKETVNWGKGPRTHWLRKRMSWEYGAMYALSLPAAFVPFDKEYLEAGQWIRLDGDPRDYEIVCKLPWKQADDPTHRAQSPDGETVDFSRYNSPIELIASSREELSRFARIHDAALAKIAAAA